MPNQIGQAYGLTVFSPLLQGHEDDVRACVARFDARPQSPFARVRGPAGPTVHTARWVLVDALPDEGGHFHADTLASKYLLLDVNLDTDDRGLPGFLSDMASAMKDEIEELYRHCVGFTTLEGFGEYIARCQVETTFFFVDYSAEERGKLVNVQKALDIQKRFVELAAATQGRPADEARRSIEAFLRDVQWTCPPGAPEHHDAAAPARSLPSQRVELSDVQGNVLRAYKFPFARHFYFRVADAASARAALARLSREVDHGGHWGATKPDVAFNLAFSCAGLAALGVPRATLDGFPLAFQMGMRARAEILGDTRTSHPDEWETQGSGLWKDGVHVLASIYAAAEAGLDVETRWVVETFGASAGLVGQQDAALPLIDGQRVRKEHFGFVDGLGTVDVQSPGLDSTPGSGKIDEHGHWTGLAPGEFLYGYRDEANEFPEAPSPPDLVKNGTFLVYRKLRENVGAFRAYLREHAAHYPGGEEMLAAKMVGRFRDGTPLALSAVPNADLVADPHRNNDFRYGDDPVGAKCPVGAHIRRSRPRDALGFEGRVADRRRLQRRGMPFGPPLPDDALDDGKVERGIVFMAYAIDIERQFEFIQQQWLNYGNSFRQGNDKDIVTGDHDGAGKAVIQATEGGAPYFCTGLPRFVDTRGGEYFFVPGIAGLRSIARGAP